MALTNPEVSEPSLTTRRFLMRRYFDEGLQQEMLVRLLVEETASEDVVITVYKTSKISKYMTRVSP